jgi:23S rRNA (pseudouridine1915-N3)-methyltransferase
LIKVRLYCFGKASQIAQIEEKRLLPRMKRFDLEVIELKESKLGGEQGLLEEWNLLQKKMDLSQPLLALSEEGKTISSVEFSKWIQQYEESNRLLQFVIGSSYGLHMLLKKHAHRLLSLTPMTLTHDYARVVLVEQIYRAQCIADGHPYHHV